MQLRENMGHVKHAHHLSPNPTYNMQLFHSYGTGQSLWCKRREQNVLQGENTSGGGKLLCLLGFCQWAVFLLHSWRGSFRWPFCLQVCLCRSMNIHLCIHTHVHTNLPHYTCCCAMLTLFNYCITMYHLQSWTCSPVVPINHCTHESGLCKSVLNAIIPLVLNW